MDGTSDSFCERHAPAVAQLARVLFEYMERLDPGCCGGSSWDELPDHGKEFYALCIENIMDHNSLVEDAMAHHDMTSGHPVVREQADGGEHEILASRP